MASNGGVVLDGDGNASDWIEIHNPSDQAINLAGWNLTDNPNNLNKWTFPNVPQAILPAGGYLVVFASSQDTETYIDAGGYMHADFALSAGGEFLAITDPDENIVHAYSPTFPPQVRDVSYGLLPNSITLPLIGEGTASRAIVPTNGSLDSPQVGVPPAWTLPGFDDSSWISSQSGTGVGYDKGGGEGVVNIPNGTLLPGGPVGFDLTDANEDGVLDGMVSSGANSPRGEEPSKALDNNPQTKWLSFSPAGTYYQFQFAGGVRHAVNGYTITSANDAQERDPYSWTLSGSNNGIDFVVIDTRTAQDFAGRHETRGYEFANNTAYEYYRFDFQTEWGATGNNLPNSIQIGEIELLTTGPVNFTDLIDIDLESSWDNYKTSIYQRIEFDVTDAEAIATLRLDMQYDDGFVAYLNGTRVASAAAPSSPHYQSHATSQRNDVESLAPASFDLSQFRHLLVDGTNVLAIHVLNINDGSSDLFARTTLTASQLLDDTTIEAFMLKPTPGAPNSSEGVSLGPLVRNVTENPPRPGDHDDLVITAEVAPAGAPIDQVLLHYRVMFGVEVSLAMADNGLGADLVAGDGIYTAVIPASASGPGQMVRWYVTATDTIAGETRFPLFLNPVDSPEYFGTVVQEAGVSDTLPVFEYFVANVAASGTEAGTRGSVYFLGEFYDNVFVRHRGGYTTNGRKFEFNSGNHFLFDENLPRVDEINLNERGGDPTYMRQVLSWDLFAAAGLPASIGQAWYTRMNDSYLDVRIFVEQPDSDLLRRTGLDDLGAFYKMGADGVENPINSSTNGVRKRTRKGEDNSDLQELVNGLSPSNPNRMQFVYDNVDIAATINYLAATAIVHDNDHVHKNYHLYRDTEGSGQWRFIPWDKDLTFGLNNGIAGVVGNLDPFSHPYFGDSDHQKIDGKWNRLIDAIFEIPEVQEMYLRRLRTLMDQFLLPPGSEETSWIENRVNELTAALQPHVNSGNWLANVQQIVNEYLPERREHLYLNHSIHNPAYPDNAGIPDAQVGNPTIEISHVEYNPASGIRDEEYVQLHNPNNTAVDISNWRIEGDIDYVFPPGTVIPAGGYLYISPDVPTFLARSSGPAGGQNLLVQGNYSRQLANEGGIIYLIAADDTPMANSNTAIAGDYNFDGMVDQQDYLVWKGSFGSTVNLEADGNRDGVVDAADYTVWRNNLGASVPSASLVLAPVAEATAGEETVDLPDSASPAPVAQETPELGIPTPASLSVAILSLFGENDPQEESEAKELGSPERRESLLANEPILLDPSREDRHASNRKHSIAGDGEDVESFVLALDEAFAEQIARSF